MDQRLIVVAINYQQAINWGRRNKCPLEKVLILSTSNTDFYSIMQNRTHHDHVRIGRWSDGAFTTDVLETLRQMSSTYIDEGDISDYQVEYPVDRQKEYGHTKRSSTDRSSRGDA